MLEDDAVHLYYFIDRRRIATVIEGEEERFLVTDRNCNTVYDKYPYKYI